MNAPFANITRMMALGAIVGVVGVSFAFGFIAIIQLTSVNNRINYLNVHPNVNTPVDINELCIPGQGCKPDYPSLDCSLLSSTCPQICDQGIVGPIGPIGLDGPQGIQGPQGFTGPACIGVGPQGIQGDEGPQGIQGTPGNDGVDGISPTGAFTTAAAPCVCGTNCAGNELWVRKGVTNAEMLDSLETFVCDDVLSRWISTTEKDTGTLEQADGVGCSDLTAAPWDAPECAFGHFQTNVAAFTTDVNIQVTKVDLFHNNFDPLNAVCKKYSINMKAVDLVRPGATNGNAIILGNADGTTKIYERIPHASTSIIAPNTYKIYADTTALLCGNRPIIESAIVVYYREVIAV